MTPDGPQPTLPIDVSAMSLDDVASLLGAWLRRPRNLRNYPAGSCRDSRELAATITAMLKAFERTGSVEEADLAAARLAVLHGSTGTPMSREMLAQEIASMVAAARNP